MLLGKSKLTFIALLTLSQFNAMAATHIAAEKHLGGRYVKEVLSRSVDQNFENKNLVLANQNDGYRVQVQREIEGFAGPVLESDLFQSKVSVGLGIEFTSGFTFTNSKIVKNKNEVLIFEQNKAIDYFKADKALKMEKGETAEFDFFAGIVLAPKVSDFGIWAVASGGWNVLITKAEKNIVEVEMSLIDSKTASFNFDKFGAMLSVDIGQELEKGYTLTLNLNDLKAKAAYEHLFKGNILFAQTEGVKNKNPNILFKKNSHKKTKFKGTGLWVRSPLFAWFLLNSTHHLVNGEKVDLTYEDQKTEKTISANYEEEAELDFIGTYHGKVRSFEASYNLAKKEFEISDKYQMESNVGHDLPVILNQMNNKTAMDEYFNFKVPNVMNAYYQVGIVVKYKELFLEHLVSGTVNTDLIAKNAYALIEKKYSKMIEETIAARLDPSPILLEMQFSKQVVQIAIGHLKKDTSDMHTAFLGRNIKGALEIYAKLMKTIYRSPYAYKAFVDYSKHCGTEVNFSLETEAFAKKEKNQKFLVDGVCSVDEESKLTKYIGYVV